MSETTGREARTPITWDPACYPTAEQFREWYLRCTEAEQLKVAGQVVEDTPRAAACIMGHHEDRLNQPVMAVAHIAAVLSDEATVEAVARAMFADEQCDRHQRQYVEANWNARLCEDDRVEYRSLTRAALAVVAERFGIEAER